MSHDAFRLLSRLAVVVLLPVSVTATSTAAHAGDLITDPSYDFDCDDTRDAIDTDEDADVAGHEGAGVVRVQYSRNNATATITQDTEGVPGSAEDQDGFGTGIAAYDENGDGCDDLVVSAPREDVGGEEGEDSGMVWVIPGSPSGLDSTASRGIHAGTTGVPGPVERFQSFGEELAAGTTGGEPFLVVGAPGANIIGEPVQTVDAGVVYYLRGAKTYRLSQDTPGVAGKSEPDDKFGERLAVSDGYIAIGTPQETIGDARAAGMVHVFSHKIVDGHPTPVGAFHQDTPGISGAAEEVDVFGSGLSVVDYRSTPDAPIAPLVSVGSPGEWFDADDNEPGAGLTQLVTIPVAGTYRQISSVNEDTDGVPGETERFDGFGFDTVLAVRSPTAVGTPATVRWVVASAEPEPTDGRGRPQVYVFDITGISESNVEVIAGNDFGLPLTETRRLDSIQASAEYLYFGTPADTKAVYGVPWGNILDGDNQPTVVYKVESA